MCKTVRGARFVPEPPPSDQVKKRITRRTGAEKRRRADAKKRHTEI